MRNKTRRQWLKQVGLGTLGLGLSSRVMGQAVDAAAERIARYPELKYINLAGNENPFGPSRRVTLTIMKEVSNSCRYPFREEVILKERIAELEGVDPDNVLLGNGCDEILSMAGDVYGKPGATLVATQPTYLQLMHYAEKNGARVEWVPHSESMHHDLSAMLKAVHEQEADLVYVCNPDTPSGTVLPPSEIRSFCIQASEHCPVFLDEVYLELLDDYRQQTQTALVKEGYPVIIGRSFSKMHGLAGHRVGYALGRPDLLEALEERRMSSLGYLGVMSAITSLDDERFHEESRRLIRQGRERFCSLLEDLDLAYTPSVGNFVFHRTGIEIRAFQALMKEKGFLVGRPFPPYDDWCRISIGTVQEMAAYEEAMREVFA
ncbi:histidinol-phosphate transaminase [Pelagicoccus sp. SDUM812003]|uniref:pyridoxal phosphate-dependent aminotransferase n=1 Tax=Pelagicoccus sp. SDUM812003 TaxID=3041267 RepID=UPI0028107A6A|nr:histidinol-phosphate transaminase [Pelagicoccus sp. SDUM812003]MDQ8204066.1 histidinol-phosphate transaminase [Pelagicoccus sp. SDUM812003]